MRELRSPCSYKSGPVKEPEELLRILNDLSSLSMKCLTFIFVFSTNDNTI